MTVGTTQTGTVMLSGNRSLCKEFVLEMYLDLKYCSLLVHSPTDFQNGMYEHTHFKSQQTQLTITSDNIEAT